MDFDFALLICARGRTGAYSRKNENQTFVPYMPLLSLNISFYLKYSLFYEKTSVCVYLSFLFQGFHGNLDVLKFGVLQVVPGHQLNLSGVQAICRCSVFSHPRVFY